VCCSSGGISAVKADMRLQTADIKPKTQEENSAMSGTSDKIKGRVKEAVGVLTDDQRLKNEGKLDQATGKIKEVVERGIDKATSVVKRRVKK
jgi:uncharacterized protein YjbJ (UPF0337 family)